MKFIPGDFWRTETGGIYKILSIDDRKVFAVKGVRITNSNDLVQWTPEGGFYTGAGKSSHRDLVNKVTPEENPELFL